MSNTNRMKPASEVKQQNFQKGKSGSGDAGDLLSGIRLQGSTRKPNKNLLEKYSFEDNDLSKSQNDITLEDNHHHQSPIDNDHDWLQLSVKQITLFSRELITFYLQIQYTIVYQSQTQNHQTVHKITNDKADTKGNKNTIGDKNKINDNSLLKQPDFKEVKTVKSKLVHGFILENQGKHLILSLKSKAPHFLTHNNKTTQNTETPLLTELQFSLIRVYETSKQGKLLCQQTIQNPAINKEYSIDFMDEKVGPGQKQKSMGTMMFELFSAIVEEPLAKRIHEEEEVDNSDNESQIPEDISPNKNSARVGYENYTLGVPSKPHNTNTKSPRNVFDNNDSQDDQPQQELNSPRRQLTTQHLQKRPPNNSQLQSTIQNALVFKLNQHSMRSDDNIQDSRMDDSEQRQHNVETTLFIDESKTNISLRKGRTKDTHEVSKNLSNNANETKQLKVKPKQQIVMSPNEYTYVEDNVQESRFQGNTTDQRENYMSTLQYSKYVNQEIILKGPHENSPTNKQNNQSKKTEQNKLAPVVESSKTPKFESVLKNAQQKQAKVPQLADKQSKRSNQPTPYSRKSQYFDESASQNNSQMILPDMDSSNIRFNFDDNDISNIQETKNMQDLINQIEKIQKEWYQKRVLNRQLKEKQQLSKNQNAKQSENALGKNMRSLSKQEDNIIDLELGKFKIKLDQGTFYNKLIDNLKNKHSAFQPLQDVKVNKGLGSDMKSSKTQQTIKPPKDYTVSIIAHELDEQSKSNESSQKMQIKIPSKQIQDLIQSEKAALEHNPQLKSSNSKSQTQNIRNQIMKDFEKQLYSKVLKIKVDAGKNDGLVKQIVEKKTQGQNKLRKVGEQNDPQKQKGKAKIIQIALQQDSVKFDLSLSDQQNQIQTNPDKYLKKDGRTSKLDQNRISLIGMYPIHLPNSQNKAEETSFYHNLSTEPLSIQMYNLKTGNQEGKLSFQIKKGRKDRQIQTFESLDDYNQNDLNEQNSPKKNEKVSLFKPNSTKQQLRSPLINDQNLPSISVGKNNNKALDIGISTTTKDSGIKQEKNFHSTNSNDFQAHPGKIIKQKQSRLANQSIQPLFRGSPTLMIDPDQDNHQKEKLDGIEVRLPHSQRINPVNTLSLEERESQNPTQMRNMNDKTRKVNSRTKTQDKLRNFTKQSTRYEPSDENDDGSPSYRLIKQELHQTADLLENLKLRAQDFLNKVQKEKKSQNYSNNKCQQQSPIKQNQNQRYLSSNNAQIQGRNSVMSEMILHKPNKNPYQNHPSINSNLESYYSAESPEGTKKSSINHNNLRQKPKKPFSLKQAGDYHFDHQQSLLPISLQSQPKGYSPIQRKSSRAQQDEHTGPIQVEFHSMKIKLLSVNSKNNKPIRKQSRNNNNSKSHDNQSDYFVLIHSQQNQNGQLPYLQKCYQPPDTKDDSLYVEFPLIKSRSVHTNDGSLSIAGKQQTRVFIELYNSPQAQIIQQMSRNYGSRLNYNPNTFRLITSQPINKHMAKPIGILPVTFLELMAQTTFPVDKRRDNQHNKPYFLNYTNFLYNGDKITGKININYVLKQQQANPHPIQKQSQPQQHYASLQRQDTKKYENNFSHLNPQRKSQPYGDYASNLSTSKNTHEFKLKNTLIDRYNQNISLLSKDNSRLRNQRSESGMTKKVSPRKKKNKQNRTQSPEKTQQSRLADPLELLKRRVPKPIRLQEKTKSHSQSYHVRVNRPFQTPINKRVGTQFDSLNSSQSMRLHRQKTTDFRIPQKSQLYLPNNTQQKQHKNISEIPNLSQPQFITPKLDKSSQIRNRKNTVHLKSYNLESRIYPTEETRVSPQKRYDGGNIKFGKSSRFNAFESPQMMSNSEKAEFPGPGHYEVKSMFDRHGIKQP